MKAKSMLGVKGGMSGVWAAGVLALAGMAGLVPSAMAQSESAEAAAEVSASEDGKQRVYVVQLEGEFGRDISQTPMRSAVEDAKKNNADVLIFVLNNDWSADEGLQKLPDDAASFDELFRAEEITPIFTEEIPHGWSKQPRIVFWVKQAMGGACFLPFISKEIYFAPQARMGGVGNLTELFGSMGDEVVRQKQFSLRLGHAQGWANVGGYPYQLVTAMTRRDYVLSYRIRNGQVELLERMPQSPDEFLLTDDGKDERTDNIQALARGEGDDTLTLTAKNAMELRVSKGTVETLDDLLFQLGILDNHVRVDQRSEQVARNWKRSVERAEDDLREQWKRFREIQVQGEFTERRRARSQQMSTIRRIQDIQKKFEEAIGQRFYAQQGIPSYADLDIMYEQIRQQQLADRR